MPPKAAAATKASAPKKTKTEPAHGTYQDMIKDAIIQLKDRSGSSRQALKKYVLANNKLGSLSDAAFTQRFNQALSKGSESGAFVRPKGASGPVKLGKGKVESEEKKPAAPKAAAKPKTASTTKKATTTKAAAPKKAAPATKKTAAAATKKTAAKPKANTSKPRKTAPAAPAVEDKAPVVLGKTKSGRVTKSKAPAAAKKSAPAKKAAPKKAAAKK